MGKLGGGITLIVIGAILTFAVEITIPGIGKDALGVILMAGGALAIALWFVTENQHRRRHTVVESAPMVEEPVLLADDGVPPVPVRRRRRYF
jgi:uncharacterized membrane protein